MQSVNYLQGERSSKLLPRQVDLHCAYGCFLATPKGPYASLLTENLVKKTPQKSLKNINLISSFFFFSVSLLQFLLNHFFFERLVFCARRGKISNHKSSTLCKCGWHTHTLPLYTTRRTRKVDPNVSLGLATFFQASVRRRESFSSNFKHFFAHGIS